MYNVSDKVCIYDRISLHGLSVSVTFMHCAQTAEDIDMISFAYDSPMSLSDCIKIWHTSVNPFLPKMTHPLFL